MSRQSFPRWKKIAETNFARWQNHRLSQIFITVLMHTACSGLNYSNKWMSSTGIYIAPCWYCLFWMNAIKRNVLWKCMRFFLLWRLLELLASFIKMNKWAMGWYRTRQAQESPELWRCKMLDLLEHPPPLPPHCVFIGAIAGKISPVSDVWNFQLTASS